MNPDALKKRLERDRPMTTVTIRMPEDVIEDLKRIALSWDFLAISRSHGRTYIGQGLRTDMERLENNTLSASIDSLKRRGVGDDVIQAALDEVVKG